MKVQRELIDKDDEEIIDDEKKYLSSNEGRQSIGTRQNGEGRD